MANTVKLVSHEASVRGIDSFYLVPGKVVEIPVETLARFEGNETLQAALERGANGGIVVVEDAPAEPEAPAAPEAPVEPAAPAAE